MTNKTEYLNKLNIFENFLDFAIDISDQTAGLKVDWHLVRANQLFTRLTVTSLSIIHLLPSNRIFPSDWEFWDFFSVATLARSFIENYHMFYYVGVEKTSDEERDFRLKLLSFHLNSEKYRLYSEFEVDKEQLLDFEVNLPKDREHLKAHPFFATLEKQKAKGILTGKEAMYYSQKEVSERIPFDTKEFTPLYRFFSNHTHSSPLAYFTISNQRGRGEENEIEMGYLSMTLDLCTKYLSAAIVDMTSIFPDCIKKLDPIKLRIIKERYQGTP